MNNALSILLIIISMIVMSLVMVYIPFAGAFIFGLSAIVGLVAYFIEKDSTYPPASKLDVVLLCILPIMCGFLFYYHHNFGMYHGIDMDDSAPRAYDYWHDRLIDDNLWTTMVAMITLGAVRLGLKSSYAFLKHLYSWALQGCMEHADR